MLAIDGTTMDVPDTTANDEHFGRAGVSKGERSAFPLARLVAVAECGTHAILDAEIGPYTTSEVGLSKGLVDRFTPGSLVIADRGSMATTCGFGPKRPEPICCGGSRRT